MKLHMIAGLPRSGTTLLCNIFNQNPKFKATSTSILPQLLSIIVNTWSNSVEIKNLLEKEREKTENRMSRTLKSFVESWHEEKDKEVIFDKSRGWILNTLLIKKLYPDTKIIVLIRDLRNVFSSIEKQHIKTPFFDEAQNPQSKTIYNRANNMFSPEGIIGLPIIGIEDLLRRNLKGVIFIQYEELVKNPKEVMKKLYSELGENYFEHDFENVKNTAIDPDGHYLYKYPHQGCGKVEPKSVEEWKSFISPDLADTIMKRFQDYNNFFGYMG